MEEKNTDFQNTDDILIIFCSMARHVHLTKQTNGQKNIRTFDHRTKQIVGSVLVALKGIFDAAV